MLREYTPAEVRELCERTKVRVKMYKLNTVWDAKRRFDKKKRLENKSESWVNRMLMKADRRRMVAPYTELEREKYKVLAACQTKKDNNLRLDRWHRQRAKASKSSDLELRAESPHAPLNISSDTSESQSQPAQSQPLERAEQPSNIPYHIVEASPAMLESQPQSQSDEITMDEFLQPVIQPAPAPPPLPDQESEPNLWGIGDEVEESAEAANDKQPDGAAETQLDSFDWQEVVKDINSESLSLRSIGSTQNTEPDYECFGTQLVAASTQDNPDSQSFL